PPIGRSADGACSLLRLRRRRLLRDCVRSLLPVEGANASGNDANTPGRHLDLDQPSGAHVLLDSINRGPAPESNFGLRQKCIVWHMIEIKKQHRHPRCCLPLSGELLGEENHVKRARSLALSFGGNFLAAGLSVLSIPASTSVGFSETLAAGTRSPKLVSAFLCAFSCGLYRIRPRWFVSGPTRC